MDGLKRWMGRKKFQFEAITSLSMLEPAEKRVLYCVLAVLLGMTLYTIMVYLPSHLRHLVGFITGH